MKKGVWILAILLFGLAFVCCKAQNENQLTHSFYNIHLNILPEQQFLQVEGNLQYLIHDDGLHQLAFKLHKNMVIDHFSVNGDTVFHIDTSKKVKWVPDAVKIVFALSEKTKKGDVLEVAYSYHGKIDHWSPWSANVLCADWVEMGLYFPWYPSIEGEFNYRLVVDIPADYAVFARGRYAESGQRKIFETEQAVRDLIICAAKDLTVRREQFLNQRFQLVNCTLSDAVVDSIRRDIANFYHYYSTLFGQVGIQEMCLVISKREKGGGYSRKGGLFLGGMSDSAYLNKRLDYIRYLAHEISHFWWHGAPGTWEDWLNESFAEYSALLLIRDVYSEDEYTQRLKRKQKDCMHTPSIWGMARDDKQASKVLYGKGVVLLSELEQALGRKKFSELCKIRIAKKVNTTAAFLPLLAEIGGENMANWFEQALRSR